MTFHTQYLDAGPWAALSVSLLALPLGLSNSFESHKVRYVVENAECNVIVIKQPFGASEEHDNKVSVIQAEEEERIRREEEEGPPEVHDSDLNEIKKAEETERKRRMSEDAEVNVERMFAVYKFQEALKK